MEWKSIHIIMDVPTPGMKEHFKGTISGDTMEGQIWYTGSPAPGFDNDPKPFFGQKE